MLQPPDIKIEHIANDLKDFYGIEQAQVEFLPLGADKNVAVYKIETADGKTYFGKIRFGSFDPITVELPKFLRDQGNSSVVSPLQNRESQTFTKIHDFHLILYPFVEGTNGWENPLSDADWTSFGKALKKIHGSPLYPNISRETYSSQFRDRAREFQKQVEEKSFSDHAAKELAVFLKSQKDVITHMIDQAENLAKVLKHLPIKDQVICHGDIHVGNLLVHKGDVHIVDWDQPIIAPKERDLMFIGAGIGFQNHNPEREEEFFYKGYGEANLNLKALTYYRFERIIQDMVDFCEQLLLTDAGGEDRLKSLYHMKQQFEPGQVVHMALETEKKLFNSSKNQQSSD